ncbi:YNL155W [Zygosaccharomyces parabailii]|nr:YNL155W [Zygosaccharomyces parabailii]CDH09208.1 related to AN1-type zinc finger protein YNL155W [Zygosaccharomyces bailii ISA1307]
MTQETGMLDVGTHCAFCRQLDFLPFHCKFCNGDFCENHRTKESHHCRWLLEQDNGEKKRPNAQKPELKGNEEQFFKSLLPQKGYIRVQEKHTVSTPRPKPVRSQINKSALDKLARFFKRRSKKNSSPIKKSASSSNAFVQLSQLKKTAVGDSRIPLSNRIYIWCYVVHDEERDKDAKRESLYINKIWPVGRALDYAAQQFGVPNHNNSVKTKNEEKLYLYKADQKSGEMVQLDTSGRVATSISDLDTVYLVRGTDIPAT